ncbi:putative P-loop containing nucleoside triphosphate hydrolase [Plasmopara halstedii]
MLDKVDELHDKDERPTPFICVEGLSGMGKSQLAFALGGRRPYFYWLATFLGSTPRASTRIIFRYIMRFLKCFDEHQNALRMIRFDNQTILKVEKRDLNSVCVVLRKMKAEKRKIPFFVLDEMTLNAKIDAGGGADGHLERNDGESYIEPHEWTSLVPRFSQYQLMLHNDQEQQGWSKAVRPYPVLQDIATHSRWRFARHFVDKFVECAI